MKRIILQVTLVLFVFSPMATIGQDARFSQYFNNPVLLNAAYAGNGIEHVRITAIYRNQWAGMGTPFTTQGLSVDKVVNRIGIGAVITRNGAGDASMRTLSFAGTLSYHQPVGLKKINTISAGLQVGMINKSFDPSKLTFDNQYNPDAGYDPNMSSGEEFAATSITRPDVNIGLSWQRGWLNKEVRFKPFLGLNYSHITRPDESFFMEVTRMHIKRTITGGAGFLVKPQIEIRPTFMLLNQGPSKETTFGSMVNYQLDNKNSVQLGIYNRMQDALIAYAGYQMNLLFVGMSYDVNTSELSKSGKGNNAFEISLTYSPRPKRKKSIPEKVAPEAVKRPEETTLMESLVLQPQVISVPDSLSSISVSLTMPEVEKEIAKIIAAETNHINQQDEIPVAIEAEPAPITIPDILTQAAIPIVTVPDINKEIAETAADTDMDGVNDDKDECPYIKGNIKTHGCPDSDNDGIIDMKDNCPMESGTVANKGCPDPSQTDATNQQLVKKFDNILFASGMVKLTTDDIFDIIERAIDIMYADNTTRVILSGHTDSEGDAYQNMILSQARAEVVRRYMIRQGIAPSRIETVAYGETMPLENNLFEEGKKMNRRVEINILK